MPTFPLADFEFTSPPTWTFLQATPSGDYRVVLSGAVVWDDPLEVVERGINVAIDVDPFDNDGNLLNIDLPINPFLRVGEQYTSTGLPTNRAVPVLTEVPLLTITPEIRSLRFMQYDQSSPQDFLVRPGPVRFIGGSIEVTRL